MFIAILEVVIKYEVRVWGHINSSAGSAVRETPVETSVSHTFAPAASASLMCRCSCSQEKLKLQRKAGELEDELKVPMFTSELKAD